MAEPQSGGCQCGAVRFSAVPSLEHAHVCHCRMCQKAAGNLFAAHVGAMLEGLRWTRGTPAEFQSSAGIFRGFCRECGTYLYFRRDGGAWLSLTIGAFDAPATIPLAYELGIESKLPQVAQLAGLQSFGTTEEADPEAAAAIRATSRQHPDHDTERWPG